MFVSSGNPHPLGRNTHPPAGTDVGVVDVGDVLVVRDVVDELDVDVRLVVLVVVGEVEVDLGLVVDVFVVLVDEVVVVDDGEVEVEVEVEVGGREPPSSDVLNTTST